MKKPAKTPGLHCCPAMEQATSDKCPQHGASCPDNTVRFYRSQQGGHFGIPDIGGRMYHRVIFYCPWCGTPIKNPDEHMSRQVHAKQAKAYTKGGTVMVGCFLSLEEREEEQRKINEERRKTEEENS